MQRLRLFNSGLSKQIQFFDCITRDTFSFIMHSRRIVAAHFNKSRKERERESEKTWQSLSIKTPKIN